MLSKAESERPPELSETPAASSDSVIETMAAASDYSHINTATIFAPDNAPQLEQHRIKRGFYRIIGALALSGGYLATQAEAAAANAMPTVTETHPQGSGFDWSTPVTFGVAITTALAAVITLRNQTKEKIADRFHDALKDIKGESTGEERLARLNPLASFTERRRYAPEVFRLSLAYLRGRREGLIKIQRECADNPTRQEEKITERRNADRSAFKLFLETLPRARRQMRRQALAQPVARILRIGYRQSNERELRRIDKLTGLYMEAEKPLVNARGICLDDMRGEVRDCNLTDVDLTGAALQRNEITRVSFKGARLREVQLEGSNLSHCGLEGADFRAAYLGDTDFATFEACSIDASTQFGNLPDNHPYARRGKLDPARSEEYRGIPNAVLINLCSETLSDEEIIQLVHSWQSNGLVLKPGSNPEYYFRPKRTPNHHST
jgi:hypothetical protein